MQLLGAGDVARNTCNDGNSLVACVEVLISISSAKCPKGPVYRMSVLWMASTPRVYRLESCWVEALAVAQWKNVLEKIKTGIQAIWQSQQLLLCIASRTATKPLPASSYLPCFWNRTATTESFFNPVPSTTLACDAPAGPIAAAPCTWQPWTQ